MRPLLRFEQRAFSPFRLLLVLACLALAISPANASAVFFPVTPSSLDSGGFLFDIKTAHFQDGNVGFRVIITAKDGHLPNSCSGSVGCVDMSHGWSSVPGFDLDLKGKKDGASVGYDFIVPDKKLADPRLFFVFSYMPVPNMPAINLYYARLKDFSGP